MKKKLLAVTCMALASTFSFAACNLGGGLPGGDSVSDSTGTGNKKTIVEALDIEGFNAVVESCSLVKDNG